MASKITLFTPEQLRDLFRLLDDPNKGAFLRLIGREVPAQAPFIMLQSMDIVERQRFADMITNSTLKTVFPLLVKAAAEVARELPQVSTKEMEAELQKRFAESLAEAIRHAGEVEAEKLKRKRNRKPSLEIAKRNIEICELRRQNPRKYTEKKLAEDYTVSDRHIRDILSKEDLWRSLLAKSGTK
jgi:hypothetical protein